MSGADPFIGEHGITNFHNSRIRSIVNGLRDDDAESFYDNRASFTSEYSAEGVKVFFKEHGRKGSKSSNTSLLSRKKQQNSASQRPETKVCVDRGPLGGSCPLTRLMHHSRCFSVPPRRLAA